MKNKLVRTRERKGGTVLPNKGIRVAEAFWSRAERPYIGSLCCVASIVHSFAGVFATSYGEEETRCELAWFVSKQLYSSDVRANVCRLLCMHA